MSTELQYKKKDFMTDQLVRWCPGCGDYSILSNVQTAFSKMGIPRENFAVISGIGCSSRFPYYMETYGFHTIHGRAPAFASGLKVARPDLSVWVITGDGDCLSIGGNHIIHLVRRNIDVNVLLFNNRIYGLTKGQYSPTSEVGKKTKSSPMGSLDYPFNPLTLVLGAGATFVARTIDVMGKHMQGLLHESKDHRGTGFIEIFQNCNIFNDGAFEQVREKQYRGDTLLMLENGKPMVFGKTVERGIVLDGASLKVVDLGDEYTEADCLVHDETSLQQAQLLAGLQYPQPTPIGVLYRVQKQPYDQSFHDQVAEAKEKKGWGELQDLVYAGDMWNV